MKKLLHYIFHKSSLIEEFREMGKVPELPPSLLESSRVMASRVQMLEDVPKGGVMTEVGTGVGNFTEILLTILKPTKFHSIDVFQHPKQFANYQERFARYISDGVLEINKGLSWEELDRFPNKYFDYIYIDAGHSYDAVVKDIKVAKQKIKSNGLIQFNDYTNFSVKEMEPYGVKRAVHEFMISEKYELVSFGLQPNGYYDVLVRKQV